MVTHAEARKARQLRNAKTFIIGRTPFQVALYIVDGIQCSYVDLPEVEALLEAYLQASGPEDTRHDPAELAGQVDRHPEEPDPCL